MTAPLPLPQLPRGAPIRDLLLVVDRIERRKRDGEPFWVLTLGNRTGRIESAPVWRDQAPWIAEAAAGRVVQVVGEIDEYAAGGSARRQLRLTAPVRAVPPERCTADHFLPCVADAGALLAALDALRAEVRAPALRAVLARVFDDPDFRPRFARAPGSAQGHHARIGGLLEHTVEVAGIAVHAARTLPGADPELATTGALLHDVGKVDAYAVGPGGFAPTEAGLLVGHVVLGLLHLERRLDDPCAHAPACTPAQRLELRHLVLAHHGSLELGSPVVPMTVEAELVHWADEASAKGADHLDAHADPELWPDDAPLSRRSWRLQRRLWRRPAAWHPP